MNTPEEEIRLITQFVTMSFIVQTLLLIVGVVALIHFW